MLAVVVSRADEASVHVGDHLRAVADWETDHDDSRPDADGGGTVARTDGLELREFEELHLHLDRPAEAFDDPDLLVFASRHAGETGPLLTAHHTGNVGPADHGGDPNSFARACPNAHSHVLEGLATHAPEGYEVGMECTHHGPSDVGAPSMFVEVGSGPEEWADPDAARAVARAILDLRGVAPDREAEGGGDGAKRRHLLGVGGGHYAPRFERVRRETDWAVGHVAADWGLETLDLEAEGPTVFERALDASAATHALVDGDRPDARAAVEQAGGRVVTETWVRETDGVALGLVDALETEVATVAAGLRLGEPATEAGPDSEFVVADLPEELLAEARGIDQERTLAALQAQALAVVTDQGGTRPAGPVALAAPADRDAVVESLTDVLRERYDSVERTAGAVIARETAFDPEKAKTLGVPEGPKFGRLSAGEAVEVDGDVIPPDAVRTERTRRFQVET